ncbi:MAG TPA: c-type cytochrome [Thermoanaerobaculaceae bacterium]|nr:c-type cytochrome [Thermoanaerobaculaceae bacterium]
MSGRRVGTVLGSAVAAAAVAGTALAGGAQAKQPQNAPAQQPHGGPVAPPAAGKTAGEASKNIRVLKDVPADQLLPTMQFVAASLGVECNFCHVQGAFDKDDRKEKQTARKMMEMMAAINRDNFDGDRDVTCFTCHRGSPAPLAIPAVATGEAAPGPEAAAAPPALPSADRLLDKWAQAVGADALGKVATRVQKGQLIGFGGHPTPIEVYAKAPDKRISVMQMPRGEMITAYDGTRGWLTGRDGPHPMSAAESEAARLDADLAFPLHVKRLFTAFAVRPSEKIGDREAVLVVARNEGKPPVKLYLDKETGLLLREERYAETALGYLPTQIDYADYRDVDGVKVAFRWTLARPSGRFTIQIESTQQNVPVDDARFAMPAPPPGSESQPR